ncbi:MAG: transglutaminase domain-containing protein, partial [Nitrospirota bacterium]|nr:transglutaminase domain-containing protein [Nitrospirota bacterium]
MYEYVKNNIETEWYWGCMKGAEETLRQKSGNDCDQATLLASLLRASGFPTRYVRGTMEFFPDIEKAKNLTGIDDPLKMAEFFQKAGIPYKPVIQGGKIANIEIEHVWIESRIPYGNYRGTMIDNSDPTWLGLDTSIKPKGYTYSTPLELSAYSSQLSAVRDEYLGAVQTQTPLEYFKEKITAISGQQADSYKLIRTFIPESMKILPNTMQFDQKKVTHEYTEVPDELKHKVRFTAKDKHGSELFDLQLSTFQLSNKRVALTYEPETVEDQQIIDSYGGLDNTPAYLVRLRPVLKVNEERVVVGKDGLPMGTDYDLTIELISPNGIERITNTHISGNLAAIRIVAQRAISSQLSAISEEDDAESILYKEANRYIDRWNQSEDELASLLHLAISRPLPTVVTVGGVIDVTYLLDMPHGFEWKGVFVDASKRAIEVTPSRFSLTQGGEAERKKTFMQLSGLQGSVLEHRIFEDDFEVESISTAKLIQIVGANGGSPILTIDKTNITAVLPTMTLEDNIKADIGNAVNQGFIVRIPQSPTPNPQSLITYLDWTGIGYIKEDPSTGEAGYMLSGMIAGGMTAVSPNRWIDQDLVGILGKPYAGQYTTISITSPKNESILFASPITVSGIALDPNSRVTVNNIEASREGNTFTAAGIQLTRGMNRIIATATNSEGVSVSNSINVKYRILLRTFITFPYEGANLSVRSIDIEGIVSDPAAAVEIGGINAVVSPDGRFIARGVPLSEGANQITVRATNSEGDVDIQTITVTRQASQTEPTHLTITSPT